MRQHRHRVDREMKTKIGQLGPGAPAQGRAGCKVCGGKGVVVRQTKHSKTKDLWRNTETVPCPGCVARPSKKDFWQAMLKRLQREGAKR